MPVIPRRHPPGRGLQRKGAAHSRRLSSAIHYQGEHHARRHHQDPAQGLPRKARSSPIELVASLDDSAKSRARCASCSTTSPRSRAKVSVRDDGNDARKPSFAVGRAGRAAAHPLRRHADGPRIHLAGAGAAADRRPPAQGRRRA